MIVTCFDTVIIIQYVLLIVITAVPAISSKHFIDLITDKCSIDRWLFPVTNVFL